MELCRRRDPRRRMMRGARAIFDRTQRRHTHLQCRTARCVCFFSIALGIRVLAAVHLHVCVCVRGACMIFDWAATHALVVSYRMVCFLFLSLSVVAYLLLFVCVCVQGTRTRLDWTQRRHTHLQCGTEWCVFVFSIILGHDAFLLSVCVCLCVHGRG